MSNKIMCLWGFIIFLICGFLIVLGNIGDDYNLYKLKRDVIYASKDYFAENDNENDVELDYLINENYLKYNEDFNNYCIKRVIKEKKYYIFNKYKVIIDCE